MLAIRVSDEDRIEAAAKHGYGIDPVGGLETAAIIVGSVFFGLTAILVIYSWFNHMYQPIRAKNLPQNTLMLLCGIMWFVGDIGSNGLVKTVGVWAHCRLWNLWIRFFFTFMFSCCVFVRVCALFRLFICQKQCSGLKILLPYTVAALCMVIFCLVGQLVSPEKTVKYDPEMQLCLHARAFHISSLVLRWIIWVFVVVFMWLVRNIQASFNEVRESLLIVIIALIFLVQNTVFETMDRPVASSKLARNAITWTDFICANLTVWVILTYPVYQSIFHRKSYLRHWRSKLMDEGFKREYGIAGNFHSIEATMCILGTSTHKPKPAKSKETWDFQDIPEEIQEVESNDIYTLEAGLADPLERKNQGTFGICTTVDTTMDTTEGIMEDMVMADVAMAAEEIAVVAAIVVEVEEIRATVLAKTQGLIY
ncbi:hypothetical protein LPJ55_002298 [Coemansia sp. RSA 990]|nr:hypothetical protein LPJ55_002298 [Coemansia sp. RSA 990]